MIFWIITMRSIMMEIYLKRESEEMVSETPMIAIFQYDKNCPTNDDKGVV